MKILILLPFILYTIYHILIPTSVLAQQTCNFTEANCSWDAVSGAANYTVKVTETDTNTVIKNETVAGTSNSLVFPVTQGKTYQCDVAAVNSCGQSGSTGTGSAICEVQGLVESPSPISSATPGPTVAPTITPTPAPTPVKQLSACAYSCNSTADCQAGLMCVSTNTGVSYCAQSQFQSACQSSPSLETCCQAPPIVLKPAPPPVLPPSGDSTPILIAGGFGLGLILIAVAALIL